MPPDGTQKKPNRPKQNIQPTGACPWGSEALAMINEDPAGFEVARAKFRGQLGLRSWQVRAREDTP